jgi:mono/diheme cytochrome c family protein
LLRVRQEQETTDGSQAFYNCELMSENNEKKVHGIVAEYTSVDTLLAACRRVRDAGYEKTDAFTPFPVHGIDKALGIKPTVLPWIVLGAGLTGTATALVMQIWMNAIDYQYIISGKPFLSLPAFMPVAFELTVLFASFGAFFGMWALNGLPRFSNPVFTDPRFDRVTDDRFFLYIDSKDGQFDRGGVEKLLGDTETDYVQTVVDDDSSDKVPKPFFVIWGLVASLSVVPLLIVLKMRVSHSSQPRFHVFYDMDFSPAKDAQQYSTLFRDGRAMRPDVPGTVARGEMQADLDFMTGIDMNALSVIDRPRADRLVRSFNPLYQTEAQSAQESKPDDATQAEKPNVGGDPVGGDPAGDKSGTEADKSDSDQPGAEPTAKPSVMDTTPWLRVNPLVLDEKVLANGRKNFGIYCSVCHGMNGSGNGLVNVRAQKILAAEWIPPSSLHQDTLYADKYPDGKLFSTISNGIRKMPGYSGQIKTRDRWEIVAYVRALQLSQNASIDQISESQRESILKEQAEAQKALKEKADAEAKAAQDKAAKAAKDPA